TRRQGVQPIEVLNVVRNAHNAFSSLSLHETQDFLGWLQISKLIVIDSRTIMEETHHRWRFWMLLLSLRTTEYRDRVEPMNRIIPRRLKTSCVGYCPGFQDLHLNIEDNV
nr:hypothetical protein [Tanacetum cinerariifolium]